MQSFRKHQEERHEEKGQKKTTPASRLEVNVSTFAGSRAYSRQPAGRARHRGQQHPAAHAPEPQAGK